MIKSTNQITGTKLSNICIFRDEISLDRAVLDGATANAANLCDPAIISALYYKGRSTEQRDKYIAINFRDTSFGLYTDNPKDIKETLYDFIYSISKEFKETVLVPMHTFFWGGDDRLFFAKILGERIIPNVRILYEPISLPELYKTYEKAFGCVGMRYHAILLQTVLNGNNIILDYTEKNNGKIAGFIRTLGESDYYRTRYINVNTDKISVDLQKINIQDKKYYEYKYTFESEMEKYRRELGKGY